MNNNKPNQGESVPANPQTWRKQMEAGLKVRLMLLINPVSIEKKNLLQNLTQTLAAQGLTWPVWMILEAQDNQAEHFLFRLGSALVAACPRFEIISTPAGDDYDLADAILNALDALQERIVLILDEYEVLIEPSVHDLVAYLIDYLPEQAHMVILSTQRPVPLPLARLLVRKQMVEIILE